MWLLTLTGFLPLVRLVFTSLWCFLDLDWSYEDVTASSDQMLSDTGTDEGEWAASSTQCFLHTWRWKVSVSGPEVSSAGENPTRGIWKCLNRITLITLCCSTVWLDTTNVSWLFCNICLILQIFIEDYKCFYLSWRRVVWEWSACITVSSSQVEPTALWL